jgi:hypothetical protein
MLDFFFFMLSLRLIETITWVNLILWFLHGVFFSGEFIKMKITKKVFPKAKSFTLYGN